MERRVELFAAIRFDWQRNQMPIRALARKYDVHRRTVRQAIASPVPPDRKVPERAAPVREAVAGWIDEMLAGDLAAPRKQRHTARRVFERLADEHGAQVSYSYVAKYVARRRAEIAAQDRSRHGSLDGFVPQVREPGAEAEAGFGDVAVELAGQLTRCFLFAFRLSYSGKACHRVYASQAQEAFLEGHVAAFEAVGGVPFRQVRYDNLAPAVARVLAGRSRVETTRWLAFRAHYGFEAFYCQPGAEGAHEKGGIEGEIGRFRRRWFVPVPQAGSLAELNARLAGADAAEDARHVAGRAASIGQDLAAERDRLLPLPAGPFATAAVLWPRVDRYARISVGKCRYSVPARLIGSRVRVMLAANELRVFDGPALAAVHPRLIAAGDERLELDHYLEIVLRKPGALPGAAALAQARAAGAFTAVHEAFWAAARARHGDAAGTRALIEVLLLHRRMPASQVTAGMTAALAAGSCSPDVVAVEARKHAAAAAGPDPGPAGPQAEPHRSRAAVITLPARRDPLPPDGRPAPSVAACDQLLAPRRGGA
ncbi:MAG TPA: IS21 family transposase [Streptosporangiaceae bacterium]|nr:IS21 family transposase [Streptosporangiaceae bacterium]